eukprot:6768969-Alexandrium_andersonii.AAC.1
MCIRDSPQSANPQSAQAFSLCRTLWAAPVIRRALEAATVGRPGASRRGPEARSRIGGAPSPHPHPTPPNPSL